jgi:hypothetical protein
MSFWTLLLLCLLILAVQAAVILATALHALRRNVESRWNSYIRLQSLLLRQINDAGGVQVQGFELLMRDSAKGFEDALLMAAVRKAASGLADDQAQWAACVRQDALHKGIFPRQDALPLRVFHAQKAYDAAVDAFERRRLGHAVSLFARWLGLGPVYRFEETVKILWASPEAFLRTTLA